MLDSYVSKHETVYNDLEHKAKSTRDKTKLLGIRKRQMKEAGELADHCMNQALNCSESKIEKYKNEATIWNERQETHSDQVDELEGDDDVEDLPPEDNI